MKDITEILLSISLSEKEDLFKASYKDYKAFLYDALYEVAPEVLESLMDEIIIQEELLDLDEHPSLTNEERNK